jgi:hypothetical protein
MFPKLTEVRPLPDYTISLTYNDGTKGNISLKELSNTEVFSAWKRGIDFNKVFISHSNIIAWNDELEIDAESLYLELKGISYEQWKEANKQHASAK